MPGKRGVPLSEEHKRAISIALTGRVFSEAHKRNLSLARKGMRLSDEHKANVGKASRGRKHSAEAKRKMSIAKKGNKNAAKRPEVRRKISISLKRRFSLPEEKQRLSKMNAGANNPRWRGGISNNSAIYSARYQGRKRNLPDTLTAEQAEELLAIGQATYPGKELHLDHVVPLSKGGGTTYANMHAIPARLNLSKRDALPREIYRQLELEA